MSHRVLALYHDLGHARVAAEDLVASGVSASQVRVAEGTAEGTGRVEVSAPDHDRAINIQAFLQQDGAISVDVLLGNEVTVIQDTMPPVPEL